MCPLGYNTCLEFMCLHNIKVFSELVDFLFYVELYENQRTIGPENAHLNPDLGVLSHHEMTLTLNTHTPLLTS